MKTLNVMLIAAWLILGAYSVVVIGDHGLNLVTPLFNDIAAMNWSGQFNLDFLMLLAVVGLWVSWRQGHSAKGIVLGIMTATGGCMVLFVYLVVSILQAKGDAKRLMLGVHA